MKLCVTSSVTLHKNAKDLSNMRLGKLLIMCPIRVAKRLVWYCRCDCGRVVKISAKHLATRVTHSCGRLECNPRFNDLAGQRFGRLIALCVAKRCEKSSAVFWECACDCGETTIVRSAKLSSEHTRSCGCLRDEKASKLGKLSAKGFNKHYSIGCVTVIVLTTKDGCVGGLALIDTEDLVLVNDRRWILAHGYVLDSRSRNISRVVLGRMGCEPGLVVDHIDHNKLDNRKRNLRVATSAQNKRNSVVPKNSTTGYKGCYWHKRVRRYQSTIGVNNKYIHLGYFDTPEEAAKAYNEAAKEHFGEYAYLNEVE